MRILVAGSSGFLGSALVERLATDGHAVTRLVRRQPAGPDEVRWDPRAGEVDPAVVGAADAVVNLAGAPIAGRRWTARYKEVLRASRVDTTATLARTIAALPAADRPAVLINAAGAHWYGDTGDRPVDEDAPAGTGFLPDLVRVWEAATRPAESAGVRVVLLRNGLVLHRAGGLLKPLLIPFRLGLGGRIGSGRRYLPVISRADWLEAVVFLLNRPDIAGPVNMTGPAPVTNAEFTRALGAQLHRPALIPVPALALRLAVGEAATVMLDSLRVVPKVLSRAGFRFRHPDVRSALRSALCD
ncbi:MAG: TIGR01777 family protein [Micromonosporaceae bacterium]|nr:TIGR01777 family protein [Micromonosporaceae bacterium]